MRELDDETKKQLYAVLNMLDERACEIIMLRYGLDGLPKHTLKECGKHLNLSAGRIREIEQRTLIWLQHPARTSKIERPLTYLE